MELIDSVKVIQNGASLYLVVPSRVARVMGISKGTKMQVSKDGERIVYERKHELSD